MAWHNIQEKYLFVLLGPSDSNKTTYGETEFNGASKNNVMFLSTGLELRKRNLLNAWQEPDMTVVRGICNKLISEAVNDFKRSKIHQILILDCVQDLEDAEYVAAQAMKHGLKVTRALLIFTTHTDLKSWIKKSHELLTYYMKLKLLCTTKSLTMDRCYRFPSLQHFIHRPYHAILRDFPLLPSPNFVQALLIDSAKIKSIISELNSILKVNKFSFALPASIVNCHRDVTWVANPFRYHLSPKANGTRCLLVKIHDGTYLITRKKEIYPCCIIDDKLPENTVLDGEFLPSTSISKIHSALLKTTVFLVSDVLAFSGDVLWKWPFSERQETLCNLPVSKDISAVMKQASKDEGPSAKKSFQSLPTKESNQNGFRVHCVVKEHKLSTPSEILGFISSLSQLPYPSNSLVFTPNTTYLFGQNPLLFKWRESEKHLTEALVGITGYLGEATQTANPTSHSVVNHPLACYSFEELYAKIAELIHLGCVEKTVDLSTDLEILNYCASPRDRLVSLCRGLVLHPATKSVVTKPFIRFFETIEGEPDLNEDVEATIKYDGSLGIAFVWNDDILVTTKRRMNSEQATWAKQWIKNHCNLTKFKAGYTYMFEIVYQNNTVIVNYLFEGLVLLAITDDSGYELPYEEMLHCARAIGFTMVTSRISGPYSEILWYCGGIDLAAQNSTNLETSALISGTLPANKRQEGWVVKFNNGKRQKIVSSWWKEISSVAHLVHPQIVWLLVKHDRVNEILGNVPDHLHDEIHRMIRALGRKFVETTEIVRDQLTASSSIARNSGVEMHGVWGHSVPSPLVTHCTDEEDIESHEQTKQISRDGYEVIRSDTRTGINEEKRVREDCMMMAGQTMDLAKLARKLEPYLQITEKPKSLFQTDDGHVDVNVSLSPVYNWEKLNYLRLPVLDYICPETSPALEGYEPSDNFKQTWCKGWKPLPINDIRFVQAVFQKDYQLPPFFWLPDEVIYLLLEYLDGKNVAIMAKVCVLFRKIVRSSQVLRSKIAKTRKIIYLRRSSTEAVYGSGDDS